MSVRGAEMRLPQVAERELGELWTRIASRAPTVASRAELRAVARAVVGAIQNTELLPEHLVVAVKSNWECRSASERPSDRSASVSILNDLVSLCIDEYFVARTPRTEPAGRRPHLELPLP
jgi:hypothetical protein